MPTKRQNPFLLSANEYKRDLNVIKHYVKDAALYIHQRSGKPLSECETYVKKQIGSTGAYPIKDPQLQVLTRNPEGDRDKQSLTLSQFLFDIADRKRILSPALVVYHNAEVLPSLAAEFIEQNIKRRSQSKKEEAKAKEEGNKALEEFKKNEQKSFKISNNSLSGAQASAATILYNKTAHTSLTSTCRTATSYGNANNEKFLYGNRHYWSPETVKGNLVSILRSTDEALVAHTLEKYRLRAPTVDETCAMIEYSTNLYWKNTEQLNRIRQFVETLTDVQRASFVYTGDLYHLAQYNPKFVRELLDRLSQQALEPISDPEVYLAQLDPDLIAFVSLLCADKLSGTSIEKLKTTDPLKYALVGATAKAILFTLEDYKHLIQTFWRANTVPPSVGNIRSSLRRGVITSDTDSTIFTVQSWTEWFVGRLDFSEKSQAVSYAVVYLATQTIAHVLAMVSAGMGVAEKHIFTLTMKNEFAFPVFALTSMAKHYFAYISAREGKVYSEYETEIKGVYLKDSNAPAHIMTEFHNTLRWCMDQVVSGEGISLSTLLPKIAAMEKDIETSIRKGDTFYLNGVQIKDPTAYKNPASSPHVYYELWQAVFAPTYGAAPEPPYAAVKVSVNLNNQTKLKEWLATFKDPALVVRMEQWLQQKQKTSLTTFLLPRSIVEVSGIPEEIINAMNIRKIIYGTVKPFYILLDALGLCYINKNLTRLVSDVPIQSLLSTSLESNIGTGIEIGGVSGEALESD
jgi:hypothetical protein